MVDLYSKAVWKQGAYVAEYRVPGTTKRFVMCPIRKQPMTYKTKAEAAQAAADKAHEILSDRTTGFFTELNKTDKHANELFAKFKRKRA